MTDTELDAKGLKCPLPVLKTRKALKGMVEGAVLRIEATDPGAVQDFRHFCDATGYILRGSDEEDGVYVFFIERT